MPHAVIRDGSVLVTKSADHALCLWDISSGKQLARLVGHTDLIMSVKILPNERYALSGSVDNTMRLWDLNSGKEIARVDADAPYSRTIELLPDGKHFMSTERWNGKPEPELDHTIHLWRLPERVWPENNRTARRLSTTGQSC